MKLFEVIETEWNNSPATKELFRRKQLSACHDLISYVGLLARKYPSSEWPHRYDGWVNGWIQEVTAQRFLASWADAFAKELKAQTPEHEFNKFQDKFDRMIAAKLAYEKAGGKTNRNKTEYI